MVDDRHAKRLFYDWYLPFIWTCSQDLWHVGLRHELLEIFNQEDSLINQQPVGPGKELRGTQLSVSFSAVASVTPWQTPSTYQLSSIYRVWRNSIPKISRISQGVWPSRTTCCVHKHLNLPSFLCQFCGHSFDILHPVDEKLFQANPTWSWKTRRHMKTPPLLPLHLTCAVCLFLDPLACVPSRSQVL